MFQHRALLSYALTCALRRFRSAAFIRPPGAAESRAPAEKGARPREVRTDPKGGGFRNYVCYQHEYNYTNNTYCYYYYYYFYSFQLFLHWQIRERVREKFGGIPRGGSVKAGLAISVCFPCATANTLGSAKFDPLLIGGFDKGGLGRWRWQKKSAPAKSSGTVGNSGSDIPGSESTGSDKYTYIYIYIYCTQYMCVYIYIYIYIQAQAG